jgi:hypothetical protein
LASIAFAALGSVAAAALGSVDALGSVAAFALGSVAAFAPRPKSLPVNLLPAASVANTVLASIVDADGATPVYPFARIESISDADTPAVANCSGDMLLALNQVIF